MRMGKHKHKERKAVTVVLTPWHGQLQKHFALQQRVNTFDKRLTLLLLLLLLWWIALRWLHELIGRCCVRW